MSLPVSPTHRVSGRGELIASVGARTYMEVLGRTSTSIYLVAKPIVGQVKVRGRRPETAAMLPQLKVL